jgi:hypothetical protein
MTRRVWIMYRKPGNSFLKTMLLLIVVSLFPLLTIPVFAVEKTKTWDISYQPEPFVVPIPIGPDIEIDVSISLDASGKVRVTDPAGVASTVTIPKNGIGFSHIFPMPEIGEYSIKETYTLVFSSTLEIPPVEESFTDTDEWEYDNSDPRLMKFRLDDMYVDTYSITISPANALEVLTMPPSPARPGDTGIMTIRTLRDIQIGEIISVTLTAKWHKKSSLTQVQDNEPPSITHVHVQSIPVGSPITAKVTDNLKVDSATLYFKDASSSEFLPIPMTPTGQPDTYEGYIPITAKGGNGSYYLKATDTSSNERIFPTSPYSILVKPFGDVSGDGLVSASDAGLVLQNAVGLIPFSDEQRFLGDVSGDGTGSSYDAGLIFQYADGLIDTFPVQAGGTSSLDSAIIQAAVTVSIPDLTGVSGSSVIVSINTSSASGLGIIGIDITLDYDSGILPTVSNVTTPTWAIAYNVVNGQVIIGMANSVELGGEGTIANVEFGISGQATGGQTSPLNLTNLSLNEGGVSADTTDGTLTVVEQIEIDLRQGWNLFSICLQVEDNSLSAVLDQVDGLYESVWTLGSWKQYFPDDPNFPGGLDVIMPEEGYWIDMEADHTLTITGIRLANTTIWLEQGWNLVGYKHPKVKNVEDAQLFTPGDNTAIYTYEEGVWKKYHAGDPSSLNDLDQFKPGNGYYIYVTTPREWTIPSP